MNDTAKNRKRRPLRGQLLIDAFSIACEHLGATDVQCHPLPGGRDILVQAAWPAPSVRNADVTCSVDLLCPASGGTTMAFGPSFTLQPAGLLYHRAIRSGAIYGDELAELINGSVRTLHGLAGNISDLTDARITEANAKKFMKSLFKEAFGLGMKQVVTTRQRNELTRLNECFEQGLRNEGVNHWAMFAGMLRFTHQVTYCRGPRRAYLMAGKGHRLNNIAFDLLARQAAGIAARQHARL
jgi:hypothetical protein